MTVDREKISFLEFWNDIRAYGWSAFRADLAAGLNVALLAIPQAMAYAMVAGLPVVSGFLTAIVAAMIAAVFGSSRHLVMGPTNVIAMVVGIGVSDVVYNHFRYIPVAEVPILTLQLVLILTLLTGVIQIIAGLCRLGRLTQLVSHSVAVGYVIGIVIAVYASQSFDLFGIQAQPSGESILHRFYYIFEHFRAIHLPTLALGVGSMGILMLLKRYIPRMSPPLLMLIIVSLITYWFGLSHQGIALVSDSGPVSFSEWSRPDFIFSLEIANALLPTAFAVAILSMLDATAVGKTLAARSGQRLSSSQELVGLGLANLVSGAMGGMPSSASPSRSIANYAAGAQTRLAAVFSGIFIVAILSVGASLIGMVPVAGLAAVILVSATQLVEIAQLQLCWKATSSDRYVLLATIACCILFSLETAFYLGVGISVTLFLQQTARPQMRSCEVRYRRSWRSGVFNNTKELYKWIQVVQVDNELFFGAADLFQDTLKAMTEEDTKIIVLVMRNSNTLDATACLAIEQLHEYLSSTGRYLILCGITFSVWRVLEKSGLADKLGRGNLFALENRPRRSVDYALERAVAILDREGSAECKNSPLRERSIVPGYYQVELHHLAPFNSKFVNRF